MSIAFLILLLDFFHLYTDICELCLCWICRWYWQLTKWLFLFSTAISFIVLFRYESDEEKTVKSVNLGEIFELTSENSIFGFISISSKILAPSSDVGAQMNGLKVRNRVIFFISLINWFKEWNKWLKFIRKSKGLSARNSRSCQFSNARITRFCENSTSQ